MKLHASRDERDLEDAAKLANIAGVTTQQQGVELLGRMYPPSMLLPRHRYIVDEVMDRAVAERAQAEKRKPGRKPASEAPPLPPFPPTAGPSGPTM